MLQSDRRRLPVIIGLMLLAFALYRFDSVIDLLRTLMSILSPFLIGLFMALLINLPMRTLDRALVFAGKNPMLKGAKRALTLTLSMLFVLAVIAVLLVVIIPEVVTAVERLIQVIPSLLKELETWLIERNANIRSSLGLVETNENEVRNIFLSAYQFLIGGLSYSSGVVISAAQYLVNLVIALVFAIYLLFSKERIRDQLSRFLRAALPKKINAAVSKVIQMLITSYSNFLGGQCLQAFISSTLTAIILMLFGFPYAVLTGLITFVAAFIPVFGPYISGLLGMLLVLTADPGRTLWFLLIFFLVQQVTGSVIYPRIMSNAIDIPSIWILIAVTLGGGILGIPGMLIFIPLVAVVYHLTADFVQNREKITDLKASGSP